MKRPRPPVAPAGSQGRKKNYRKYLTMTDKRVLGGTAYTETFDETLPGFCPLPDDVKIKIMLMHIRGESVCGTHEQE